MAALEVALREEAWALARMHHRRTLTIKCVHMYTCVPQGVCTCLHAYLNSMATPRHITCCCLEFGRAPQCSCHDVLVLMRRCACAHAAMC